MSVSHATPSFLHSRRQLQQRAERRAATEPQRRHRTNLILGGIGVVLFGVLIAGFIGMATTIAPRTSPSAGFGTDGSLFVTPPGMATLWLAVTLMDVVAIFAYGIATAVHNQQ